MSSAPATPIPAVPKTLSEYPPLMPAEDFAALMKQSTAWLPEWCRDIWTDFNVHDPGIMILEQLTYALTELPYRANLPLPRLLVRSDGSIPWDENSFYAPTVVLPMQPLTAGDYARLLYDRVVFDGRPALVHAAVGPAAAAVVPGASGWLQASLMFDPALPEETVPALLAQADSLLADHGNLGQRFAPARRETPVFFNLTLGLDLAPGARASVVIAQIYSALKQALLPGPAFLTLHQALAAGLPIEEALAGPLLRRGVLAEGTLPAPCTWLEAQERACRALRGVPGILRLARVEFELPSPPAGAAFFAPVARIAQAAARPQDQAGAFGAALLNIQFAGTGAPVGETEPAIGADPTVQKETDPAPATVPTAPSPDLFARAQTHAQAFIEAGGENPSVQFTSLLPANDWLMPSPPPPGDGSVSDYYSIQHQFPRLFRLEADALPPDAPEADVVAVRQLKGYLLPFEQLMANYFAQLGHVADFFSNRPQRRTVFTQPLADVPESLPLFSGGPEAASPDDFWSDPANPYLMGLATIAEDSIGFSRQRQRVLDHLLARFNESYPVTDLATYETIANKEALLRQYPRLGRDRAAAARPDPAPSPDKPRTRSGLEEKVQLLLRRDLQRDPPPLRALASAHEGVRPSDFYFVFEPIRFLPPAASSQAAPAGGDGTVAVSADDFGAHLFHVFLNWTFQPLTPALRRYAEELVRQNAPAHLWHRFIWIETLGPDPGGERPAVRFLQLAQAWLEAGAPPLDISGPAAPGDTGLAANTTTPAGRLFVWLKENAPAAAPSPA